MWDLDRLASLTPSGLKFEIQRSETVISSDKVRISSTSKTCDKSDVSIFTFYFNGFSDFLDLLLDKLRIGTNIHFWLLPDPISTLLSWIRHFPSHPPRIRAQGLGPRIRPNSSILSWFLLFWSVYIKNLHRLSPWNSHRNQFPLEDLPVAHILMIHKLSCYLKHLEITICKYASRGLIPTIRIGCVWRFDKDVIDDWIRTEQNENKGDAESEGKGGKESCKKKPIKRKT